MKEYKRRAAIIENLCAGRISRNIIMFFEYSKSTTYDVAKRYAASKERFEEGSPAKKKHAKKKTTRTPKFIQRIQEFILEETSIRKLTTVLKENYLNVLQIVEEDLRYTSYVFKYLSNLWALTELLPRSTTAFSLILCVYNIHNRLDHFEVKNVSFAHLSTSMQSSNYK